MTPEVDRTLNEAVVGVSRMIDGTYPPNLDAEAHMWRRCMKVVEECGETTGAILGLLDENPRKGRTHTPEQVRGELFDVALAALGAVAYLTGNGAGGDPVRLFEEHALRVRDRLADALNPHPDRVITPGREVD
jgi:hypothetical protein